MLWGSHMNNNNGYNFALSTGHITFFESQRALDLMYSACQ